MEKEINNFLIDSDVLIDYLRGSVKAKKFFLRNFNRATLYLSVVNIAEIFTGRELANEKKVLQVEQFLKNFVILGVDQDIAKIAGRLRRDFNTPFADAFIAAIAFRYNLVLVTRNTRHFKRIPGLIIRTPYNSISKE
jgi:predicted nucleic acid-binding protein